jgi:glycosyltransferase involved in cell wall biosynthesis
LKVSGAMPVHNDSLMLRYSLPALVNASLDELVFLLDRCTDESEQIIKFWKESFNPPFQVRTVKKDKQSWKSPVSEAFQAAFENCKGDVIYSLAADCIYDPIIFNFEPEYDAICYNYVDRDLNTNPIRQNYEIFLQKFRRFKRIGDVFAVKKYVWKELGGFKDHAEADVWHPHGIIFFEMLKNQGFKYAVRDSKTIHLRCPINANTQISQGRLRAKTKSPLWRVISHSVIHVKPYVLIGYLQEINSINYKAHAEEQCV